jgi:hypothetical protein
MKLTDDMWTDHGSRYVKEMQEMGWTIRLNRKDWWVVEDGMRDVVGFGRTEADAWRDAAEYFVINALDDASEEGS